MQATRLIAGDLEVITVGHGLWRVRDVRIPGDDARCVLGFIQREGGAYEVVRMADPGHRLLCHDLDTAIHCLEEIKEKHA